MLSKDQIIDTLETLLKKAKVAGADGADALMGASQGLSVSVHNQKLEQLERSESFSLGLRVLVGQRQAMVSSTDFSPKSLDQLVTRALEMARVVPEDPYVALASPQEIAKTYPDVDSYDATTRDTETLISQAKNCEKAALSVKGITQTNGASASWGTDETVLLTSHGFVGHVRSSGSNFYASVIAEKDGKRETNHDYSAAVFVKDLESPEAIGLRAGERTLKSLGSRKPKSGTYPVVIDNRESKNFLGLLARAINGKSFALKQTFLLDKLNKPVFGPQVTIVDDPLMKRGFGSRPFDGEGLATQKRTIVEKGILKSLFLDLGTAKQLNMKSTASAARSVGSLPTPSSSNLYMQPGPLSPKDLMADIQEGIFVTDLIGSGADIITGDFSVGAKGFWIEKGVITHPISEMTLAGNLMDMFQTLTPASDLEFRQATNAPTVRIDRMVVSGE